MHIMGQINYDYYVKQFSLFSSLFWINIERLNLVKCNYALLLWFTPSTVHKYISLVLEYFHLIPMYTSTPLHFREEYCTFYCATFIWQLITLQLMILHTKHTIPIKPINLWCKLNWPSRINEVELIQFILAPPASATTRADQYWIIETNVDTDITE